MEKELTKVVRAKDRHALVSMSGSILESFSMLFRGRKQSRNSDAFWDESGRRSDEVGGLGAGRAEG